MKKVIAWLLVLALTAAVSIGATLAYLTDTDEDVNVMTLGKVKIDQLEYERVDVESKDDKAEVQEFHDNKPLLPAVTDKNFDYTPGTSYVDWEQIGKDGYTSDIWDPAKINNEVDKMVFIKNKGDYDAYVRSVFAFEAGKYTTLDEFQKMVHLNLNETDWTWEWTETPVTIGESTYFVATATYNKVLAPGALTEISLSQIALDKTATNEDVEAFGDTYQVLVKSQGIQADGFDDPDFALNEGFGVIDENNVPWTTDSAVKGIDLKTALHNLEGNTATPITANVTSVTFGLNKDYANIVDNYTGTLIDVEQDVPVYAYYVKNGSSYDVYCLANDAIYAPKNSTGLFQGMTNVTSIETDNFDVSRVDQAVFMFRDCTKLPELDTTDWDTSNITNMQGLFYKCNALGKITGIEEWNVSKVESLYAAFYNMHALTELDLSKWDTGSLKNWNYGFANNNNLETINLTGWDLTALETAEWTFRSNPKLKNVIGSKDWYMPNNTSLYGFFSYCSALESVDVHNWEIPKVTKTWDMFVNCTSLITVPGIGNWDFGSVVQSISMFNGCKKLQYLDDLSGWDVSNVSDMGFMFYSCQSLQALNGIGEWQTDSLEYLQAMFKDAKSLTKLDVADWNVSKVKTFNSLFSSANQNTGNMKLTNLDLSKWDTSSATTMGWMFYGCGSLTEVNLSNQTMPNLTTMSHMFADCYKLEHVYMDNWETPALLCMDGVFNNCEAMKSVDLSSFDTAKVKEFSQLFEACYSLEEVIGMDNWETSAACTYTEMFSGCRKLKKLDLSSFNTSGAFDNYTDMNNSKSDAFVSMFSGVNNLEELIVSDKISYLGNGNVSESKKLTFPNPVAKEGFTAKWKNVDTGELYLGKDIPEKTAATYVAYYEPIATTP